MSVPALVVKRWEVRSCKREWIHEKIGPVGKTSYRSVDRPTVAAGSAQEAWFLAGVEREHGGLNVRIVAIVGEP